MNGRVVPNLPVDLREPASFSKTIETLARPPEFCLLPLASLSRGQRWEVRARREQMSYIDVAIPAIIGLVALVRPQLMFYGSRATPDEKKIRMLRWVRVVLLLAAQIYLCIKLAAAYRFACTPGPEGSGFPYHQPMGRDGKGPAGRATS